jgi:cell division protein FtsA
MKSLSLTLYLEINDLNYIFYVGESDEQNNFKIVYEKRIPLEGIEENKIYDLEKAFNIINENIYLIEQKLNHIFKEIVIILDNFNPTFINLTGYKKLNSSQVLRENVTYILNTLKSCVDETELKKTVLHIFNSKFCLDNKEMENLPIGLFGDFYSHELSFTLININNYKNLKSIFNKCNLKVKKILIKSFIKGANINDNNKNIDTFFQIQINETNSKIFYFENNSLKFEQNFKFGSDIIVKDISKITSLKIDTVKLILNKLDFKVDIPDNEFIEKTFFNENSYRKIKKKLIYEIALARIKEIYELLLFKNINFKHYDKDSKNIFFEINHELQLRSLEEIYKNAFSMCGNLNIKFMDHLPSESMLRTANNLVYYGWKKEAIPIAQFKKSKIAKFFDTIFG